jgi:DNA-binding transcriptional MerR regulator
MSSTKKETLKVQEVVDILQALYSVQEIGDLEFAKRVSKSTLSIEKVLKPLDDTMRPSKEFEELAKLVNKVRDDEEAVKKLEEEHKEVVEERLKQIETVEVILQDFVDVELTYIEEDILPKDINAKQLKGLQPLII